MFAVSFTPRAFSPATRFPSLSITSLSLMMLEYVFLYSDISVSSGFENIKPVFPSTMSFSPGLIRLHMLSIPTTAGIPSDLAMITACEVSPPFSITTAETVFLKSIDMKDGPMSFATSIEPSSGSATCG